MKAGDTDRQSQGWEYVDRKCKEEGRNSGSCDSFGIMGLTAGCGTTEQKSNAVSVKTMKVLQQDVSVSHDYSGEVQSTDAVAIKPRVSGSIVEKYFTSGQAVQKGQPLYKIDRSTIVSIRPRYFLQGRMWIRPGRLTTIP